LEHDKENYARIIFEVKHLALWNYHREDAVGWGGVIKKLSAGRLLHDLKVSWNLHHLTSGKRAHICHVAKPYRLIIYTVVERKSWAILPNWDPYWSSWNDILPKKESEWESHSYKQQIVLFSDGTLNTQDNEFKELYIWRTSLPTYQLHWQPVLVLTMEFVRGQFPCRQFCQQQEEWLTGSNLAFLSSLLPTARRVAGW